MKEQRIRMKYRQYKERYFDCEVVKGSYDQYDRTIIVIIPNEKLQQIAAARKDYKAKLLRQNNTIMCMKYSEYRKHYSDCKTVPGSYHEISRTIEVIIPDGRMKPSGVRGKSFHGYELWFKDQNGEFKYTVYRAVSIENAMKRHEKYCKEEGWTPCAPPEGKVAHIY